MTSAQGIGVDLATAMDFDMTPSLPGSFDLDMENDGRLSSPESYDDGDDDDAFLPVELAQEMKDAEALLMNTLADTLKEPLYSPLPPSDSSVGASNDVKYEGLLQRRPSFGEGTDFYSPCSDHMGPYDNENALCLSNPANGYLTKTAAKRKVFSPNEMPTTPFEKDKIMENGNLMNDMEHEEGARAMNDAKTPLKPGTAVLGTIHTPAGRRSTRIASQQKIPADEEQPSEDGAGSPKVGTSPSSPKRSPSPVRVVESNNARMVICDLPTAPSVNSTSCSPPGGQPKQLRFEPKPEVPSNNTTSNNPQPGKFFFDPAIISMAEKHVNAESTLITSSAIKEDDFLPKPPSSLEMDDDDLFLPNRKSLLSASTSSKPKSSRTSAVGATKPRPSVSKERKPTPSNRRISSTGRTTSSSRTTSKPLSSTRMTTGTSKGKLSTKRPTDAPTTSKENIRREVKAGVRSRSTTSATVGDAVGTTARYAPPKSRAPRTKPAQSTSSKVKPKISSRNASSISSSSTSKTTSSRISRKENSADPDEAVARARERARERIRQQKLLRQQANTENAKPKAAGRRATMGGNIAEKSRQEKSRLSTGLARNVKKENLQNRKVTVDCKGKKQLDGVKVKVEIVDQGTRRDEIEKKSVEANGQHSSIDGDTKTNNAEAPLRENKCVSSSVSGKDDNVDPAIDSTTVEKNDNEDAALGSISANKPDKVHKTKIPVDASFQSKVKTSSPIKNARTSLSGASASTIAAVKSVNEKMKERREKMKRSLQQRKHGTKTTEQVNKKSTPLTTTRPVSPKLSTSKRLGEKVRYRKPIPADKPRSPPTKYSTPKTTIPKAPKLSLSKRHGEKVYSTAKSTPVGVATHTHGDPSPRPRCTLPIPFHLSHSNRKVTPMNTPNRTPMVPMAESMENFTRNGYRESSNLHTPKPVETPKALKSTIPLNLKVLSRRKTQKRPLPKSQDEIEEEMMSHYKSNPFRARPVNDNVMLSSGELGLPKKMGRTLTTPSPFKIRTSNLRHRESPHVPSKAEIDFEEMAKQFQAMPMPDMSYRPPPAATPTKFKLTTPSPFKLSTETRHEVQRAPSTDEIELTRQFKAKPIPKSTSKPTIVTKVPHVPTVPTAPKLSTSNRSERHKTVTDNARKNVLQRMKEKRRQSRLQQKNQTAESLIKPKPKPFKPTQPAPFKLHSDSRGEAYQANLAEKIQHEHEELQNLRDVKAKPCPHHNSPFTPARSSAPLTEPAPFKLESEVRGYHHHEALNKKRTEEEIEQEQAKLFKGRSVPKSLYQKGFAPKTPSALGRAPLRSKGPRLSLSTQAEARKQFDLETQKRREEEEEKKRLAEEQHQRELDEEIEELKRLPADQGGMMQIARPVGNVFRERRLSGVSGLNEGFEGISVS